MSSSAAPTNAVQSAAQGPAVPSNNKKRANRKKKGNKSNTAVGNTTTTASNTQNPPAPEPKAAGQEDGVESEPVDEVSEELETLGLDTRNPPPEPHAAVDRSGTEPSGPEEEGDAGTTTEPAVETEDDSRPAANGHARANGHPQTGSISGVKNAELEAMPEDHEALRLEVEQLRNQLETTQESHSQETAQLRADLEDAESAKEYAETQYHTLLNRVEKIKETLGDRLKRDKAELEDTKDRVDELERQNDELQRTLAEREEEAARLRDEVQEQGRELVGLRSRSNLSQQNWLKEKDDITRQMQNLKGELESTTAAMGEWEVIAMEERSLRESLSDKVSDLEEQVATAREAYERAESDRDAQSQAVGRLQRALQELQDTRKRELREMVESTEEQVQALKKLTQEAESRATEAESSKETLTKELERTAPFEKEVKEKNLLIGKLRHEAIVLNDHLTKALKYIKKDQTRRNNRQILQVMANLLNWTDDQREKAGLARPGGASSGGSGNTLRLPSSPFHRTPSSPALSTEFLSDAMSSSGGGGGGGGGGPRESLADLWASFLEQSVDEATGGGGGGTSSRKDSVASKLL
ncbi:hypothetical protein CHGG_10383 [Chaetomium globosum CBS 148.51]|uniref:GRIP domain-containing protein n=1 Tax=Chaetomium globosum (strain ATCC 6205 / CBS 148.51 / DSM 1962 / NBRC 6347 / NRRL 1970) TaxID=306901 RepID=Q2GNS1_CHAGB|nr:uncharacterized protein CHGG_10383 [Chaetomium globosum CBS 148.51]EAQ83979.1 hypothetical protein CHGG_10383 [Chaetomium globosum CBS 148.51]